MDKRIAICIIAALLVLVVTAAYAPNTGSETEETEKAAVEEKTVAKTLDKVIENLDKVIENQKAILAELKVLKENQALMRKDLKYIRSKTH